MYHLLYQYKFGFALAMHLCVSCGTVNRDELNSLNGLILILGARCVLCELITEFLGAFAKLRKATT